MNIHDSHMAGASGKDYYSALVPMGGEHSGKLGHHFIGHATTREEAVTWATNRFNRPFIVLANASNFSQFQLWSVWESLNKMPKEEYLKSEAFKLSQIV